MRRIITGALFLALAACSASTSNDDAKSTVKTAPVAETMTVPTDPKTEAESSNVIEIGHSYVINAKTFGNDDRTIAVRLPAGYEADSEQTYPVVYVIDGGPDQDFPHIAGIAQSRDLNWTFSPFILVGIATQDRGFELTPPFDDQEDYRETVGTMPGGAAQFRHYIETDIMPWVNGRYRTNGQDAVIGESLAGLFIVDSFLKKPELFDDYIAVSPSLWWNQAQLTKDLGATFKNFPEGERRLYLTMADEGFMMQKGLNQLVSALKSNAPKGLKWTYIDRSNSEHHGSIYHPAALDAFRKFYALAGRTGGSMKYLYKDNVMPTLSEDAQASLQEECNLETARKVSFAEKKKDPAYWNGMCVLMNLGPTPTAGNWD